MGWVAKLNDGRTIVEGSPIPGKRTPWQELLHMCREDNLEIEELKLTVGNTTVSAMPRKACRGYIQVRESIKSFYSEGTIQLQGIGSIVGDMVYITWINLHVSQNGIQEIYQDARLLSKERIHTTLSQEGDTWTNKESNKA